MARTVTLAQLKTRARLFADQRVHSSSSDTYVSDTELTGLINERLAQLHDLFVAARGDDYDGTVDETTITLGGGVARYDLPADFYQLLSAELVWASKEREPLRHITSHPDTSQYSRQTWDKWSPKGFRIRGGQIQIYPAPTSTVNLEIQYAPAFQDLVGDSDTYDGVNGWERAVTLGAAIDLVTIARDKPGNLPALYQEQIERIEAMVDDRQAQDPDTIRDVEGGQPWQLYRW